MFPARPALDAAAALHRAAIAASHLGLRTLDVLGALHPLRTLGAINTLDAAARLPLDLAPATRCATFGRAARHPG